MAIRFFDMFAGIGGFRSGLEAVGGFECIGHCEIDKRTNMAYCAIYDTEGEYYCDDARKINPDEMPDFDCSVQDFLAKALGCGKAAWIRRHKRNSVL